MMIILTLPGSDIGKAKGSLRSDPEAGQDLECPCKVGRGRTMSSSPDLDSTTLLYYRLCPLSLARYIPVFTQVSFKSLPVFRLARGSAGTRPPEAGPPTPVSPSSSTSSTARPEPVSSMKISISRYLHFMFPISRL